MNIPKTSKYPPLSRTARWISGLIGVSMIVLAGWLYYRPPVRKAATSADNPRTTSQSTSDAEPSPVVIAVLTAGVILIIFGLNGVKMNKLSSPIAAGEAEPMETSLDAKDLAMESILPAANQVPQNNEAAHAPNSPAANPVPPNNGAAQLLVAMVSPMLESAYRPPVIPPLQVQLSPRELQPGQPIKIDPRGFTNTLSVFFFSHDIMLCFSALLCGAPRKMITYTARQAMRHLSQIGFSDTPLFKQLTEIVIECDADLETEFSAVHRHELAVEVFRLSRNVGTIIQQITSK